ncbi:MFS transporter [Galactobacter valiniphilus]|uniref:hypothetical protein n=1 Tax=Galactobacter valiniphilus TaxID=2676122 RepID=UPI001314A826|nr:hypothetical protein [Galactobacter valiniphilus]
MTLREGFRPNRTADSALIRSGGLEGAADAMVRGVLPVVAVAGLGAGTGLVGVLNALGLAAFLVLGVWVGRRIDAMVTPERAMALSSLLRAAVGLVVVLAWWAGLLRGAGGAAILIATAAIVGVAEVFYGAGQGVAVARTVPVEEVRNSYGRIQTSALIGDGVGRLALAGVLMWGPASWAWAAAAVLYVLSCANLNGGVRRLCGARRRFASTLEAGAGASPTVSSKPVPLRWWRSSRGEVAPGARAESSRTESPEGEPGAFSLLFASVPLRRLVAVNAVSNAAAMASNTVLPVLALAALGVPAQVYVGVGVLGAVSSVAGAAAAASWTAQWGLVRVRVVGAVACLAGGASVLGWAWWSLGHEGSVGGWGLAVSAALFALQGAAHGAGTAVANVAGADLLPRCVPPHRLGAVAGAQRTITLGVMPLSAALFGVLGQWLGVLGAAAVWVGLLLLGVVLSARLVAPSAAADTASGPESCPDSCTDPVDAPDVGTGSLDDRAPRSRESRN